MVDLADPQRARLPVALKDPFLKGCGFKKCGMHGHSNPVRPRGSWDAEVMWLGEAAGTEEKKRNCTFVGPAGQLTQRTLALMGVDFDKSFICPNICLCWPPPPTGSKKRNGTPSASDIKCCRPHLEKIVELHKPQLIVLVGGKAAQGAMNNFQSISKIVGNFFGPGEHKLPTDADLYVIWHPAYILRNMGQEQEWKLQLIRLRDYMLGRQMVKK